MSSAYAYRQTEAETRAVADWLEREGLSLTRKPSAQILDHPARRQPLGLRPVPDDNPAPADDNMTEDGHVILHGGLRFSFRDNMDPAFLEAAAVNDFVVEMANGVVSIADGVHWTAKQDIAAVRTEAREQVARLELQNSEQRAVIAELKATVAELAAKVGEVAFVSERLRIDKRGPPGLRGERGRDGPPGRGEKGERGERGDPAPMIVGWRVDSDRHLCTPQYSDGASGAPLNLSSFVSDCDDEEGDE
jgi:hypothetical protein